MYQLRLQGKEIPVKVTSIDGNIRLHGIENDTLREWLLLADGTVLKEWQVELNAVLETG